MNVPFGDPVTTGNVLADYADAGGGVILTLASFVDLWTVQGRFLTGGYHPFLGSGGPMGGSSLGDFNHAHPIMQGVTAATGEVLAAVNPSSGAERVAEWAFGQPFVATKGPHVAAINIFLGASGYWTGDVPLILHNAAFWSRRAPRWVTADPTSGTVPAGARRDVTITFDATGLDGGDYEANIVVDSNDPDASEVAVPARLHVTGVPDMRVSTTALDFGSLFIGASRTLTVRMTNEGTDVLAVSGIESDSPDYGADATGFSLGVRESRDVGVAFRPSVTGSRHGTLTITGNDPDTPVATVAGHTPKGSTP